MNKKILKVFIIYMILCFALLGINVSSSTIIKTVETLDGTITINPAEPNGNFEYFSDMGTLFKQFPNNVFLIKFSYRLKA